MSAWSGPSSASKVSKNVPNWASRFSRQRFTPTLFRYSYLPPPSLSPSLSLLSLIRSLSFSQSSIASPLSSLFVLFCFLLLCRLFIRSVISLLSFRPTLLVCPHTHAHTHALSLSLSPLFASFHSLSSYLCLYINVSTFFLCQFLPLQRFLIIANLKHTSSV